MMQKVVQIVWRILKLLGEHICLMYVGFNFAFTTIHHDKLFIIMYDLDFLVDCLEAVKNL